MEFSQFKNRITGGWPQHVYDELEDILTTLILIQQYKSDYLNAVAFHTLFMLDLEGKFGAAIHIDEKTLNKIKAKHIILYARILNLHEIKMSLEDMEDENDLELHPFFRIKPNENGILDDINDKMLKLREQVTRAVHQNRKDVRVEMGAISVLLWALFLAAPRCHRVEKKIVEDHKVDHIRFLVDDGKINYYVLDNLINLVSCILENVDADDNLIKDICPTLFYIQSHIIISICNETNDFIGHDLVIKLVTGTFRNCKELCEYFWAVCECDPLYTIIIKKFLCHPEKPELLFEILQPLICSTESANRHVVDILDNPIIGNNYTNWWDVLISTFEIPFNASHPDEIYIAFEKLRYFIHLISFYTDNNYYRS